MLGMLSTRSENHEATAVPEAEDAGVFPHSHRAPRFGLSYIRSTHPHDILIDPPSSNVAACRGSYPPYRVVIYDHKPLTWWPGTPHQTLF